MRRFLPESVCSERGSQKEFCGEEASGVSAFFIDPASGEVNIEYLFLARPGSLLYQHRQTGQFVLVASYGRKCCDSCASHGWQPGATTNVVQRSGSGSVNRRAKRLHLLHSIRPDPTILCDRGPGADRRW